MAKDRTLDPVRLGVVGCGPITRRKHLRVLASLPSIEVVAVADRDARVLKATADEYGIAGRYGDVDGLLDHDGVEAVAVVVPAAVHADVAVAALEAGKHVLVEKPLAATLEGGRRIVAAAERSAGRAVMGFHTCFHRLIEEAGRLALGGRLGELESVRTLWCSPWANPGHHGERSPAEMRRRHGESALVDLGTPSFDLWRRLTGQEVELLWAQRLDGARREEVLAVTARLSNDVLATGSFSVRTSHEIEVEICGSLGRLRVSAERFDGLELIPLGATPGSARQRVTRLGRVAAQIPAAVATWRRGGSYLESFHRQWAHFARVVRGLEPPGCTVEDGLRALAITVAARDAAESGRPARPGSLVPA